MDKFDICIVGAGVIGLAIARSLSSNGALRNRSIVVLERESGFGQQTSSRNSEVIHAGIYYPPGSLKARFCVRGKQLLYSYCQQYDIPHKAIGKYIVAQADQIEQLKALKENAMANGVEDLRDIDQRDLRAIEPAVNAHCALHSPSTGIIDSHSFMLSLLHQAQRHGVEFAPYTEVESIEQYTDDFIVRCRISSRSVVEQYQFRANCVINCAGLQAHEVAQKILDADSPPVPAVYYCKGDYFSYALPSPLQHLIYPLPEKNTTGLGIHATLDMTGLLRFGPDTQYINNIHYNVDGNKAQQFADAIRSYFPRITPEHLLPAYAGIRPKLAPQGKPAGDFIIQQNASTQTARLIQLFGIESPGLTASLAIGEYVESLVADSLD